MNKVKTIFFLTEEEAKQLRKETNDPFIDHLSPHFEMEDGSTIYGKVGGPAVYERWHCELPPNIKNNQV